VPSGLVLVCLSTASSVEMSIGIFMGRENGRTTFDV
jgi:hypothetical protein